MYNKMILNDELRTIKTNLKKEIETVNDLIDELIGLTIQLKLHLNLKENLKTSDENENSILFLKKSLENKKLSELLSEDDKNLIIKKVKQYITQINPYQNEKIMEKLLSDKKNLIDGFEKQDKILENKSQDAVVGTALEAEKIKEKVLLDQENLIDGFEKKGKILEKLNSKIDLNHLDKNKIDLNLKFKKFAHILKTKDDLLKRISELIYSNKKEIEKVKSDLSSSIDRTIEQKQLANVKQQRINEFEEMPCAETAETIDINKIIKKIQLFKNKKRTPGNWFLSSREEKNAALDKLIGLIHKAVSTKEPISSMSLEDVISSWLNDYENIIKTTRNIFNQEQNSMFFNKREHEKTATEKFIETLRTEHGHKLLSNTLQPQQDYDPDKKKQYQIPP